MPTVGCRCSRHQRKTWRRRAPPYWSNPCKHVAAALYLLAEAFDDDPFLIFAWRGRSRAQLLDRLRMIRGGAPAPAAAGAEQGPVEPLGVDGFWKARAELGELRIRPMAAAVPDGVLRQLGPLGVEARGRDLTVWLAPAYETVTREAERRALGG